MAWKPREKEINRQDVIDLAKKELMPFWHGSEPLLAGSMAGAKFSALPLNESFKNGNWMLFFADLTTHSGEDLLVSMKELYRRYSSLQLQFLLFLKAPFPYFLDRKYMGSFIRRGHIPGVVAVDHEGLIFKAFGAEALPKFMLLSKGLPAIEASGHDWLAGLELKLHDFLRTTDPGLALLEPFSLTAGRAKDLGRIDFLTDTGKFKLNGNWKPEPHSIVTKDEKSQIWMQVPGKSVAIVGQAISEIAESTKILVELDGAPVRAGFAGEDLAIDEDGLSVVRIDEARVYHILENLTPGTHELKLKFPAAARVPAVMYGVRFAG